MMNLITVVVEEGYIPTEEAQSFNADTQSGKDKALNCFRELLNGYDVDYDEESLEYHFANGGIIHPTTSVKIINSIL